MTGIYKITNMSNGKVYIGQAVDIRKRWSRHRNDAFKEHLPCYDYPIYRAIRKYGLHNFEFEVLIECEPHELDDLEIEYISQYNSYIGNINSNGYNQTTGGGGVRGHIVSEHVKQKISNSMIGVLSGDKNGMYGVTGEAHPMYGKHHSEESRQKMSEKHKGMKSPNKGKFGSNSSYTRQVICENIVFDTIKQFAEHYNINCNTARSWLSGHSKIPKKWVELGLAYYEEDSKIEVGYDKMPIIRVK